MVKTDYQQALDFLYSRLPMFSRIGAAAYKPGLERVEQLSKFFGNPEKHLKAIHIAGTNGKGSTSHIIAAALQASGYKTALYTSPHLIDFRERMKINGDMIPEEKVVEFVEKWKNCDYDGDAPSFFELTMMMAFEWFADEKVDYAVIETGMGGRLDSTNILSPLLCVITNISADHTQFLGHTLPEIASEKAGIIKRGIPVVIGEAEEKEVEEVFRKKASDMEAPILFVDKNPKVSDYRLKQNFEGWHAISDVFGEIEVDLAGDYQKKNLPTALAAIEQLQKSGVTMSNDEVRKGVAHAAQITGLSGRWTVCNQAPVIICDTGHNIAGLRINLGRLREMMEHRGVSARLRMVIGFVADKAIDDILSLFPADAVYYITNAAIPRALPAKELLEKFNQHGLSGRAFDSVDEAMNTLSEEVSEEDVVFIGGSTFIVADYLKSKKDS